MNQGFEKWQIVSASVVVVVAVLLLGHWLQNMPLFPMLGYLIFNCVSRLSRK